MATTIGFKVTGCNEKKTISHAIQAISESTPATQQQLLNALTQAQCDVVVEGAKRLLNTDLIGSFENNHTVFEAVAFDEEDGTASFELHYRNTETDIEFVVSLSFRNAGHKREVAIVASFDGACDEIESSLLRNVSNATLGHYRLFYSPSMTVDAELFDQCLEKDEVISFLVATIPYTVH